MSFNKTKNVVQDSPLSGAQIDGRIPMRRIVVIADLIGDGNDMLTNAKAHRHPVGGKTDADFLMLCRRPGAIRRAHESELRVSRIDADGLAAVDKVGREAGAEVSTDEETEVE